MITAVATIEGISPYSSSRIHETPKLEKESYDAYEARVWREKGHFTEDGEMYIPPMAFKFALSSASRYLGEKIPGKGAATWRKHFEGGVLCMTPVTLGVKKGDLIAETYWMNADGVRGSGTRVKRTFPVVPQWKAKVEFVVIDRTITETVFTRYLEETGKFIGVGRFRPEKGGFYGRFKVLSVKWTDDE